MLRYNIFILLEYIINILFLLKIFYNYMYKLCILINYGWKFMFVNLKLFDLFLK